MCTSTRSYQEPYKFRSPQYSRLSALEAFGKVARVRRSGSQYISGDIPLPLLLWTSADEYSGNIDASYLHFLF